jgi:ParB-like chromosome segregation protein Spo0J
MPEVRTRDEALAAIDRALTQWQAEAADGLDQAVTAVGRAHTAAEAETTRRAQRVAVLQARLRELSRADSQQAQALYAQIQRELVDAEQSLETARQATWRMAEVTRQVARLQRSHARTAESSVSAARADLASRVMALGAYRAAGAGIATAAVVRASSIAGVIGAAGASAVSALAATAGPAAPSAAGSAGWLADHGLTDIDVAEAGFADNPITGSFGRGGRTRADYRWAVTTWDQVVRPGLDRGMCRDDFAARDAARGSTPPRRSADVYDMFLGTGPVRVERLADGRLNVIDGRHRLAAAGELGVTHLPAAVTGL